MAAQAWKVFKQAKKALGQGNIVLSSGNFKLAFVKSGATLISAGTSATTWASLKTDGITEVTSGGNYSTSGKALAGVAWTFSGNNVKLDCTDFSLSASADISGILIGVIRESAGDNVLLYSTLSTSPFDLSSGGKLTVTMATAGIVVLS